MITVNATGCGRGKSTLNRQLITRNSDTRYLVIVPSLVGIPAQRDRSFRAIVTAGSGRT